MTMPVVSESQPPFLVVTGSSAGGIDALTVLVAGLPADFNAAVVIAQHLAPAQESRLGAILRGKTALRVMTVEGREPLVPGTIYVVGPDHDVEIVGDHATTHVVARKGPKPSIDRLFSSAAASHGERLIAIIFSGMGNDGLAGARAVKEHGGTVIVQEPSSAPFPSMPRAIPPTLVDLTARPEAMGPMLVDVILGIVEPQTPNDQRVLRSILVQLRDRSGVDFTQYKTPTILRRLSRLMIASGVDSLDAYLRFLQTHPEAFARLVSAFLIKVTEFFRDAPLFDELRSVILPRLIDEARANDSELRMWSAGTSTGEEAYSLAILCAELLREADRPVAVRIFATDLDDDAIAFARRGLYPAQSVQQLPQPWVDRYFVRVGEDFEVAKSIRNMTVFGQHDLGQRAPFPRIDLCLCRNVLIYFTRELQTRALQLFAFSLRDGGFLVVGKAESTGALDAFFRTVDSTLKIYQREGDRLAIPPTRAKDPDHATDSAVAPGRSATAALPPAGSRTFEQRLSANESFGAFLAHSSIGIVLVDRRYDILGLNLAARAMLEIRGVGIGEDLIHLVRGIDASELRDEIDAAFGNESPPIREFRVRGSSGETERWLHVACSPDRVAVGARSEVVAVVVVDTTGSVRRRRELEEIASTSEARAAALTAQLDDLQRRHRALLAANDELTAANDDLRSANEQLLINSEEAASANEEIETLNEEMQATNEELETLNEELQATVEELNTTNDELESRGTELERIAEVRESDLHRIGVERLTIARALDALAGPLAVVDDEKTVYASAALGGVEALIALPPRWWNGESVAIDQVRYATTIRPEAYDGLTIVSLRRSV